MLYSFHIDSDTGHAHCETHNVSEEEAIDVLERPGDRFRNKDGTLVVEGQTRSGRYLRVIYREFAREDYIFVITAYDLLPKAKRAYRRRHRHP